MIVASDTTPINYLILIDHVHLLSQLYGRVALPQAVCDEMQKEGTPGKVRDWILNPPQWLKVHLVQAQDHTLKLGPGEQEAITLAQELQADLILLDDGKARRVAQARGLCVTGTLAVLAIAAQRGLIDLSVAIDRLQQTTFRGPSALIQSLLAQDRENKKLTSES